MQNSSIIQKFKVIPSYFSRLLLKKICIILIFLNIYVISNILFSNNNISSYYKIEQKITLKKEKLHQIISQNHEYEQEISMLQTANLDYDYLEELARKQLNYSYSDEKVIVNPRSEKI